MKTVTLKELGPQLPIGILDDKKKLHKGFQLRPYKARVDRIMSTWRETNDSYQQLVPKFVSLLVTRAGPESYSLTKDGDTTPEDVARIHGWYLADVIYAYLWARVQLTEKIMLPYSCPLPACGSAGALEADLSSVEVVVIETAGELMQWVDLRDGIKLQHGPGAGKTCRRLKLKPPTYRALLLPGQGMVSVGELSPSILREMVVGTDVVRNQQHLLTDEEIDDISKVDMLLLDKASESIAAGVKLHTELNCPQCGALSPVSDTVWLFDYFFGSSVPTSALMNSGAKSTASSTTDAIA